MEFPDKNTDKAAYFSFVCCGLLSMSLVLYCYGGVYRVVLRHNNAVIPLLRNANSPGALRVQEIKTYRVLFAIVFGFCVSWIPFQMLFPSISAWINPIIYGAMNRAIRKESQNILLCRN